jgi:hypothetical protein
LKRLTAIFFFLVLVFNFYGYRLLISYLQTNQTNYIERKVDKRQYRDDELISIKTRLHLPYYSSSVEFERAYGSINVNGVDYEYVKKRVYDDTLELLCLPNHGKSNLQHISNELTKVAAEGQASVPSGKTMVLKISLPDYCDQFQTNPTAFSFTTGRKYCQSTHDSVLAGYQILHGKPPRAMSI